VNEGNTNFEFIIQVIHEGRVMLSALLLVVIKLIKHKLSLS